MSEAKSFEALLRLAIDIGNLPFPIVKDARDELVERKGLNFDQIAYLEDLGLLSFNSISGFSVEFQTEFLDLTLLGKPMRIKAPGGRLSIGKVRLTFAGRQIAKCLPREPDEMLDAYIRDYWEQSGITISALPDPAFNITVKVEQKE